MKQRYLIISLVVIAFLLMGLYVALASLSRTQEIRPQASSCSEAPVDTQFRKYTGQDTPWVGGAGFAIKVGEAIDVTCFSRNGSALLSGGRLTGSVVLNGINKALSLPAAPEAKNFKITQAGTYSFTCSNSSGCSNTDSFTVAPSTSPSPSVSPSPTLPVIPGPSAPPCTTYKLSDLNKDCKTNLDDYTLFLEDFRKENGI